MHRHAGRLQPQLIAQQASNPSNAIGMGNPRGLGGLLRSCLCFPRSNDKVTTAANPERGDRGGATSVPIPVPPPQANTVVTLPEDIIRDVLARLPVRTLCRFRCVSKRWRALISDPAFAAAQRSSHAAAPLVVGVFGLWPRTLFYFSRCEAPLRWPHKSLELRLMDAADGGRVLGVVEDVGSPKLAHTRLGLVLVDQGVRGTSMVVDPATGRALTVGGEPSSEYPTANYSGLAGGIDATRVWHTSLGRAAPSGAYKVLRLRNAFAGHEEIQVCQVATLGGGRAAIMEEQQQAPVPWRQRPEPPFLTCCCAGCTAVVGGVLHLMCRGAPAHGRRPWPGGGWNRVASFDLESEEWKAAIHGPPMGSPTGTSWGGWDMALEELRGSLGLVQTVWAGSGNMVIWLLADSEKGVWVKKYMIRMSLGWCLSRALDILADGRILMLNGFIRKEEETSCDARCVLQLYHPGTGAHTDLMKMGQGFMGPVTLYTGSFFFS